MFKAPSNPVYHHNLAPLLLAQGQRDSAIRHYRRAIQLNPRDLNSRNDLAIVLLRMGRWQAALAALHQVVAANEDHFEGHLNLATLYFSKGRYDRAASHARRAAQLKPADAMIHRILARILDHMGNSAKSVHHGKIAIRRGAGVHGLYHPQDTDMYKRLGVQLSSHTTGSTEESTRHAFIDAYRALSGKHVSLPNSQRTREILNKCRR